MNSDNNNYTSLALTLELISISAPYQELYINKFPTMEENALSFSVDPGCSCKNKLIEHFKQNTKEVEELNKTFLENHPNEINLKEFLLNIEITNVAGKLFKIDKTEEAYSDFVQNMKEDKWAFRHMSVTADDQHYTIFFA